uniref:Toxin AahP985 n=1 Tax=Androctonus australis TaxID=6858 RepID=SCXB_ANDAU|nr:RecName: Full=Toxin AahP985; AltName: Full=Neurotoxin pcD-985; Flags: Precursor [Androctonus australis]CAC37322.1 putative toxin [Androctonus australis]
MNYLVMISLALLIAGVDSARDAYIAKNDNCVYECFQDSYCNDLCTKNGAKSGTCDWIGTYGDACLCYALPDNVPIKLSGECHR